MRKIDPAKRKRPYRPRPDLAAYGETNGNWRGGRTTRPDAPGHPRAGRSRRVLEYILIAEKALGKYLPLKAVVHHLDGDSDNNQNNNLVICEDQAYHVYLHKRLRAWRECGHADWTQCYKCKAWKAGDAFPPTTRRSQWLCLSCKEEGAALHRAKVSAAKTRYWAEQRRIRANTAILRP